MFGHYIVSTQFGFEFLQGHNPVNKGNWRIEWTNPSDPYFKFAHSQITNLDSMDEYTESVSRGKLAIKWIKENPFTELKYCAKKVGRFFMPENWNRVPPLFKYHPLNILVHVAFAVSIFLLLFRKIPLSPVIILLLIPVSITVLLSIVFYFEFRVRYYAEPFMIIIGTIGVNFIVKKLSNTNYLLS